jgi:hypothetical protein
MEGVQYGFQPWVYLEGAPGKYTLVGFPYRSSPGGDYWRGKVELSPTVGPLVDPSTCTLEGVPCRK